MKNAIVTGATRGVGSAITQALVKEGYRVWATSRTEADLEAMQQRLNGTDRGAVVVHALDMADTEAVSRYAEFLNEQLESVDVLVNNVGIYEPDSLQDDQPLLQKHMQVNFDGPYTLTQALLPRLVAQQYGHVFNMLSVVNRAPRVEAASYTISKHALWGYHRLLHQTLLPEGVKVTGLFPGSINTSSWDGVDAPRDTFIQPEDIASLIVQILSMKRGTVPSEIDLAAINPSY